MQKTAWMDVEMPQFPKLKKSIETEVLIIGGGLAGILCAYKLWKDGKKIVLIEKNRIASGATAYTTAFITEIIDTDSTDLVSIFGEFTAKKIYKSHAKAIDFIEEIVETEKIDCEFVRCANYIFGSEKEDREVIDKELKTMEKLGLPVSRGEKNLFPFAHSGIIQVDHQAKFHPLKFIRGLANKLKENNVAIFEETEANNHEGKSPFIVKTTGGTIKAKHVISAAFEPWKPNWHLYFRKGMYDTYVLELQIPPNFFPEGTYESTGNPYHYFRIDPKEGYDRMILGGEDHRSDIPVPAEKNFTALRDFAAKLLSKHRYKIINEWNGPILEPVDGLGIIGKEDNPPFYYATAQSGNGMTYSALSALIISDLILEHKNPWTKLYDPKRPLTMKSLALKGRDYSEELWNGTIKKFFGKPSEDK